MKRLNEISAELQTKYYKAAERSKSAAQGSADYARRALRNPEKAAEHEKTVAKRTAGISRYTKRYNERNPRPAVTARPAGEPYKPLGGRDEKSGKSYNESVVNPYEINEISADTARSYLDKSKTAGAKDLKQVARRFAGSLRAHGVIHRDELNKMGDRLAQQRKDLGLQKEETVAEASFWGNDKMAKAAQDASDSTSTVRNRDEKGTYTATMVRKKGEKEYKEVGRKYDNNESTTMKTLSQIIAEAEVKVHPDAIHVKPVMKDGEQKYHVQAVGSNHAEHIKVGEHLSDSELDDFSEMGGRIKHVK